MVRKLLLSLMVGALVAVMALVNASSASAVGINSKFALVSTPRPPCLDGFDGYDYRSDVYITACNTGNFQK